MNTVLKTATPAKLARVIDYSDRNLKSKTVNLKPSPVTLNADGTFSGNIYSAWGTQWTSVSNAVALSVTLSGSVAEAFKLVVPQNFSGASLPSLIVEAGTAIGPANTPNGTQPVDRLYLDLRNFSKPVTFQLVQTALAPLSTLSVGAQTPWKFNGFEYQNVALGNGNNIVRLFGSARVDISSGAGNDLFQTNQLTCANIDAGGGANNRWTADLRQAGSATLNLTGASSSAAAPWQIGGALNWKGGFVNALNFQSVEVYFGSSNDSAIITGQGKYTLDGGGGIDRLQLNEIPLVPIEIARNNHIPQAGRIWLQGGTIFGEIGNISFRNFETVSATLKNSPDTAVRPFFTVDPRALLMSGRSINLVFKDDVTLSAPSAKGLDLGIDFSQLTDKELSASGYASGAVLTLDEKGSIKFGNGTFANFTDYYFSGTDYNDTLIGGSGSDFLAGRDGDDILIGNGGGDYLFGEGGNDIFVFNSHTTLISGELPNVDQFSVVRIADFTPATHSFSPHGNRNEADTIQLSKELFRDLATDSNGQLIGEYLKVFNSQANAPSGLSEALSGVHHAVIAYDARTGALYYDSDGDGGSPAQLFAVLRNVPQNLSADAFKVI